MTSDNENAALAPAPQAEPQPQVQQATAIPTHTVHQAEKPKASRWAGLKQRIISGIVMLVVTLLCTVAPPMVFAAFVMIVAMLMYQEWCELVKKAPVLNRFASLIYVGLPAWSLVALRFLQPNAEANTIFSAQAHPGFVLYLFAMIWATDTAAYIGGKALGARLLWESISPGKTWEGLGVGVVASMIIGALGSTILEYPDGIVQGAVIGLLVALLGQAGDLYESWVKRQAGVKDSSNLIPGHGGILDRVDALVFAAPFFTIWMIVALTS